MAKIEPTPLFSAFKAKLESATAPESEGGAKVTGREMKQAARVLLKADGDVFADDTLLQVTGLLYGYDAPLPKSFTPAAHRVADAMMDKLDPVPVPYPDV